MSIVCVSQWCIVKAAAANLFRFNFDSNLYEEESKTTITNTGTQAVSFVTGKFGQAMTTGVGGNRIYSMNGALIAVPDIAGDFLLESFISFGDMSQRQYEEYPVATNSLLVGIHRYSRQQFDFKCNALSATIRYYPTYVNKWAYYAMCRVAGNVYYTISISTQSDWVLMGTDTSIIPAQNWVIDRVINGDGYGPCRMDSTKLSTQTIDPTVARITPTAAF